MLALTAKLWVSKSCQRHDTYRGHLHHNRAAAVPAGECHTLQTHHFWRCCTPRTWMGTTQPTEDQHPRGRKKNSAVVETRTKTKRIIAKIEQKTRHHQTHTGAGSTAAPEHILIIRDFQLLWREAMMRCGKKRCVTAMPPQIWTFRVSSIVRRSKCLSRSSMQYGTTCQFAQ